MSSRLFSLTHGMNGFSLAYITVLIPLIVGLRQGRASPAALLWSPLLALPLVLAAGIVIAMTTPILAILGMDPKGVLQLIYGFLMTAGTGYFAGRVIATHKRSPDAAYRRGAVVGRPHLASKPYSAPSPKHSDHAAPAITLAGYPVPAADETKHFKFIGTTGTGKSTAIRAMLSTAFARGDRAIIADPDGGYLDSFYSAERGDVILNPFEVGAAKWNLFSEIKNDYDVDQLARSFIPDGGDADRIWSEYGRTFFTAVVQQNAAARITDDAEIFRQLTAAPVEELKALLAGTPAGPFLADGNEKMFGSVRSVTSAAFRAMKYTIRQRGVPFSVRKWISDGASLEAGGRGGALFMPYKAGEIAALRSMISAWMRIAIFEAMNREEGDQRLWFVVDELDALGEIDGLKDALARLRKFGGRCVLGFQSIAQVSSTYGKGVADTIVENCSNTLILRCSASEHGGTAEFASKVIGQHQVTHTTRSISRRSGEWRKSTTLSEQVNIEPAVMASEIERLPDLEGFLKFASIPDWHCVELAPLRGPSCARSKPAPTAETMSSAANTPTPADTPTPPAPAVQTVADMLTAASAPASAPMPTVASTPTPANTSPSPAAAPTVMTPCTATPHATTRRVSKQPRKRTRKPRNGIAQVDPAPGP